MKSGVDPGLMLELANAVDEDRGHSGSLLTLTLREAADELLELRKELAETQAALWKAEGDPHAEGRWSAFGIGELQALVVGTTSARGVLRDTIHPVWESLYDEVETALEKAVADD